MGRRKKGLEGRVEGRRKKEGLEGRVVGRRKEWKDG